MCVWEGVGFEDLRGGGPNFRNTVILQFPKFATCLGEGHVGVSNYPLNAKKTALNPLR